MTVTGIVTCVTTEHAECSREMCVVRMGLLAGAGASVGGRVIRISADPAECCKTWALAAAVTDVAAVVAEVGHVVVRSPVVVVFQEDCLVCQGNRNVGRRGIVSRVSFGEKGDDNLAGWERSDGLGFEGFLYFLL